MKTQKFKKNSRTIIEDVGRIIADASGPAETLQKIAALIAEKFGVDVCSIYVFDEDKRSLSLIATVGLNEASIGKISMNLEEGLTGLVLEKMSPVFERNPAAHPRFKYFEDSGEEKYNSYLGLPLIYHGRILGVLVIQTVEETALNEADIPVFEAIASQIAGEAAYASLLSNLKKVSEGDRILTKRPLKTGTDLLKGIPVSGGFGKGYVHYIQEHIGFSEIYDHKADDLDREVRRFEKALQQSETQILRLFDDFKEDLLAENADILDSYLMYLRGGGGLKLKVVDLIRQGHIAEFALKEVILDYLKSFSRMEDPYLRERGLDIEHLGIRLLHNLLGFEEEAARKFTEQTIVVAASLSPAELVSLKQEHLKAIILLKGGTTSHVAILSRSLQIPMVIFARGLLREIKEGDYLIVDGTSGIIFHNPSEVIIQEYRRLESEQAKKDEKLESLKHLKPQTLDGLEVRLGANIGLLSDLELVDRFGADHVGLYRTEFPFLARERFPSEDEQVGIYRRVLERADGKEVTIRTLDVGGDKFLTYMDYPREDNPYLGWRSIRISLELQDIFIQQIRAILRASAFGRLKILFPMITSVAEVKDIIAILNEEKADLLRKNIPFDTGIQIGILVEVPAAVIILEKLFRYVDFISIGTNDLVQYVLAVDRNNQKVASIYNPLHPAVVSIIFEVISACKKHDKSVVICGEAAANPQCAYLYLGMGVDQLSMNPSFVPTIKHLIRNVKQADAREALKRVLTMDDAEEIGVFLQGIIPEAFSF